MSWPTPDIPLLRKVLEWAEIEATKSLYKSAWNQTTWRETWPVITERCGTQFCLAGYAIEVSGEYEWVSPTSDNARRLDGGGVGWAPDVAQRLLGITSEEASSLFYGPRDIEHVRGIMNEIAARVGEQL